MKKKAVKITGSGSAAFHNNTGTNRAVTYANIGPDGKVRVESPLNLGKGKKKK